MRVTRNLTPVEAEAEAWGPATREKFTALAGAQFLREEDGNAVVLTTEGREDVVYPGGLVIRPDGSGDGEAQFAGAQQLGTGRLCAWSPAA
jgi:hypothetical protein